MNRKKWNGKYSATTKVSEEAHNQWSNRDLVEEIERGKTLCPYRQHTKKYKKGLTKSSSQNLSMC